MTVNNPSRPAVQKYFFTFISLTLKDRNYKEEKKKSKAVPLHAMEAPGGRGGIAPTHS
jgi:hypothetical protein